MKTYVEHIQLVRQLSEKQKLNRSSTQNNKLATSILRKVNMFMEYKFSYTLLMSESQEMQNGKTDYLKMITFINI